jgi:hypothetical protein
MFVTRSVRKANFNFRSLLDSTCVWFNSHILVELSSPNEVKVKLSVVLEKYLSDLFLVDEEFPKVERRSDSGSLGTLHDFLSWLTAEDLVMDFIALSFDVQHQGSCLSLHIADQVVVVSQLKLWLELHFDRKFSLGRHNTRHGGHL